MITVVGNLKGGSGKSTVAFNLAVWLSRHQSEVSLFDLDPQKTLSDVLEVRSDEGFEPELEVEPVPEEVAAVLTQAADEGEVVVDVGTADMEAMRAALSVADRVVIPVAPSQADVWSTQRFLVIINKVVAEQSKKPEMLLFVNRADTHHNVRESDEAEEALKMLPGGRVLPCRLFQRTAYRRSFSEGLAVYELQPGSKAAKEFMVLVGHLYPQL
ncbi:ParA family protein [Ectothiorhodospiraceae bacterium BW-2]|nr:ParA family protein [Ectothiorhodospiraceae bacterium BW-2]